MSLSCGLALAYATTRTLTGLLFGIAPADAVSFGPASVGVLVVTLVASYVPARRATSVDPLVALRWE